MTRKECSNGGKRRRRMLQSRNRFIEALKAPLQLNCDSGKHKEDNGLGGNSKHNADPRPNCSRSGPSHSFQITQRVPQLFSFCSGQFVLFVPKRKRRGAVRVEVTSGTDAASVCFWRENELSNKGQSLGSWRGEPYLGKCHRFWTADFSRKLKPNT